MKQKLRKLVFLRVFNNKKNLVLVSLLILFIACLGYVFFDSIQAAILNFNEDFTTTNRQDVPATSGKWDTNLTQARLLGKDWTNMALTHDLPDNVSGTGAVKASRIYQESNLLQMQVEGINGYDNISNNTSVSADPHMVTDSLGNTYSVWFDNLSGNNEIYFSKLTPGIGWTTMLGLPGADNLSNNLGSSRLPEIVLHPITEAPYISWMDSSTGVSDIYITYWDGAKWAKLSDGTAGYDNVSANAGQSTIDNVFDGFFVVGASGNVYISWHDLTTAAGAGSETYFKKWTAALGWTDMAGTGTVDVFVNTGPMSNSHYSKVVIDNTINENPYIVWEAYTTAGGTTRDIYFTKWTANPVTCAPNPACWTDMAGTVQGYENISNTTGAAWYPQIILNTVTNTPHVVWYDNSYIYFGSNRDSILYTYWNGAAWSGLDNTDGIPGHDNLSNENTARNPQILLDSAGNPNVFFHQATTSGGIQAEIFFTKWTANPVTCAPNPACWTNMAGTVIGKENVSQTPVPSSLSPQFLLLSDNPHVIWIDDLSGNYDIYFTKWNGVSWVGMDGIDHDANPATTDYDNLSRNTGTSASWVGGTNNKDIVLDLALNPQVVWHDQTTGNSDIYYTKWVAGQGWVRTTQADNPYLVWLEDSAGSEDVYFSKWTPGAGWTDMNGVLGTDRVCTTCTGNALSFKFVLDYAHNPYIAWQDTTTGSTSTSAGDIYISKWTSGVGWTNMSGAPGFDNISNGAYGTGMVDLEIDLNGNPYVFWGDGDELFFSRWSAGSGWTDMAGTTPSYGTAYTCPFTNCYTTFHHDPNILIDSNNVPYLVFGAEIGRIFAMKWTPGTGWTNMAGTGAHDIINPSSPVASWNAEAVLDSNNNLNIVWSDTVVGTGSYKPHFIRWNGSAWVGMSGVAGPEVISTPPGVAPFISFALSSTGIPYVFYPDIGAGSLNSMLFSKWTPGTGWTGMGGTSNYDIFSNSVNPEDYFSLVMNSTDIPYILWRSQLGERFSKWNGATWTGMDGLDRDSNPATFESDIVSDNMFNLGGAYPSYSSLKLDLFDQPYAAFLSSGGLARDLYFTRWMPVYSASSVVQSNTVFSLGTVTAATLNITEILNGQTINYSLSADGGLNWEPVTPGVLHTFGYTGNDLRWRANLNTTNTAITPIIDDLSITYDTTYSPGRNNVPVLEAPMNLSCEAQSPELIRWSFEDQADDETGFKLYDPETVTVVVDTLPDVTIDISYLDEPDLETNTQYTRLVRAFNGAGDSEDSNIVSCYTLANVPVSPSIINTTDTTLTLKLNNTDNNPSNTQYAVYELTTDQYVHPDGTFGAEVWADYENWGGDSGLIITGEINRVTGQFEIALDTGTTYDFAVKARNGDNIETGFSASTGGTTGEDITDDTPGGTGAPIMTASKGVGLNIAKANNTPALAKIATANTSGTKKTNNILNLVGELGLVLLLILGILIIFVSIGIYQTIKHLGQGKQLLNKIWQIISKEPVKAFETHANQDKNGTYKISYTKHKDLHKFSQRNLKRIVGLAVIDLLVLLTINVYLNHPTIAQEYTADGQEVAVGEQLNYIIGFANNGDEPATNVQITDNLDLDLTYQTGTGIINIDGTETTTGISLSGNQLTFDIGDLNPSQIGAVTFTAVVSPGTEGNTAINQASLTGDNFTSLNTNVVSNPISEAEEEEEEEEIIEDNDNDEADDNNDDIVEDNNDTADNDNNDTGDNDNNDTGGDNNDDQPLVTPPGPGQEEPESIISSIWGSLLTNFFDNPDVEKTSQNIITPILLALILLNLLAAAPTIVLHVLPFLHLLFTEPLMWLFKKKRKKWGIVYNSLTKLPVDLAVVRLYNKETNQLLQTKVTDKDGRYMFIVKETGKYYIAVTKPGFSYPTKYLKDDKQDTKYVDLYHGEEIDIKGKQATVTANIPLDPADKKRLSLKEVVSSYFQKNLQQIVAYVGIVLALLIVLIYPTKATIAALVVHILLFFLFRRLMVPKKTKSWGIVYDQKTKQPLTQAIVRIFDVRFNKLLETQITDGKGRYSFLVGKNKYQVLAEKLGYTKKEIKPIDLVSKEQIIDLDIGLNKGK